MLTVDPEDLEDLEHQARKALQDSEVLDQRVASDCLELQASQERQERKALEAIVVRMGF